MSTLYEASFRGSVTTLKELIQSDRLILHRELSLTSFNETPLHISSLLGHLDFTRELLKLKPKLATELNSLKSSPLHFASAEGHTEIVKEILSHVNPDVCLDREQGGRIPLHLAVMRGHVKVIQELINAEPRSIKEKLKEDTVLHLCIRYNHLEALKLLVNEVLPRDREFLNLVNRKGNTILNLAVVLKQVETVKYLLSISEVRVEPKALIESALTTALENNTTDFRSLQIQDNLREAVDRKASENQRSRPQPHSVNSAAQNETRVAADSKWKDFQNYQGQWLEETRGILMVVATVIATMTFQVSIAPPGGFWQQNLNETTGCPPNVNCTAGTSVLASIHGKEYDRFIIFCTISFSSSLSIILLLISGFPLKNRVTMWVLILTMCTTVIFMAAAYMTSTNFVTNPKDTTFDEITWCYKIFWLGFPAIIIVVHILRLIFWLIKKLLICAYHIFIWPIMMLCKCILPKSRANQQSGSRV